MSERLGLRLDVEGGALSQYAGLKCNSLCRIGDVVLGADEDGLVVFGADTDDGAPIRALLASPATDFGSGAVKRVRRIDPDAASDRGFDVVLAGDDGVVRNYRTDGEGRNGIDVGRDGQGRVWTLEIENREGCGFTLYGLDIAFTDLDRRRP